MSVNAEVIREWVAALRSGKYPQTRKVLNRIAPEVDHPVGLCCLGVLCEIAVDHGIAIRSEPEHDSIGYNAAGGSTQPGGWQGSPPIEVTDWAGITDLKLEYEGGIHTPIELNDHKRLPFSEIADLIENQLL